MTRYALIPAVLLAALAGPVAADSAEARFEWFQLLTHCAPMGLIVVDLRGDAKRIGLTRESLILAAESRLRAARLFEPDDSIIAGSTLPYLYVEVHVVGSAFSVNIHLNKFLWDHELGNKIFWDYSDLSGYAATWETGSTGTHGGNGNYVLSSLQRHLDKFMAAYLRVNEEACR